MIRSMVCVQLSTAQDRFHFLSRYFGRMKRQLTITFKAGKEGRTLVVISSVVRHLPFLHDERRLIFTLPSHECESKDLHGRERGLPSPRSTASHAKYTFNLFDAVTSASRFWTLLSQARGDMQPALGKFIDAILELCNQP